MKQFTKAGIVAAAVVTVCCSRYSDVSRMEPIAHVSVGGFELRTFSAEGQEINLASMSNLLKRFDSGEAGVVILWTADVRRNGAFFGVTTGHNSNEEYSALLHSILSEPVVVGRALRIGRCASVQVRTIEGVISKLLVSECDPGEIEYENENFALAGISRADLPGDVSERTAPPKVDVFLVARSARGMNAVNSRMVEAVARRLGVEIRFLKVRREFWHQDMWPAYYPFAEGEAVLFAERSPAEVRCETIVEKEQKSVRCDGGR